MTDIFSGDPKIYLTENGADMQFQGGQPTMDGGLENAVLISLFSDVWFANVLFNDPAQYIGSKFETSTKQAITRSSLIDMQNAVEKDLQWMIDTRLATTVTARVTNPRHHQINLVVFITPPGSDIEQILLTKHGLNWINQGQDSAEERFPYGA